MPDIFCRVQHHPSRKHLIPPLLASLDGLSVQVVEHSSDPPSPWAGYQACLTDPPSYASHLLILQDDAQVCHNFLPALDQIAEANPDTPVCLFLSRLPRDTKPTADAAMRMNRRYVTLSWRSFLPCVAILWPRAKAVEALAWTDEHPGLPGQREPRSDDGMLGRWKMVNRETVLACVPSLVEHPDVEPSLIGRRTAWGKDRGRVAAFLAEDGIAYDWAGV